jgi:hypothetical protein
MDIRCTGRRCRYFRSARRLRLASRPIAHRKAGPASRSRTPLTGRRAWEVLKAESGKRRRFFPDVFKLEAVAAVRGERLGSAVASELGPPDRLVCGWRLGGGPRDGGARRAGADTRRAAP